MFFLCIPWKQSGNLLTFLRGREREHWPEVGKGTPRPNTGKYGPEKIPYLDSSHSGNSSPTLDFSHLVR